MNFEEEQVLEVQTLKVVTVVDALLGECAGHMRHTNLNEQAPKLEDPFQMARKVV